MEGGRRQQVSLLRFAVDVTWRYPDPGAALPHIWSVSREELRARRLPRLGAVQNGIHPFKCAEHQTEVPVGMND